MKKYIVIGLICFLIGAALCGAVFLWINRPGPATDPPVADPPVTQLTVNPTPEITKKAETVKEVTHVLTIKQPDKMSPEVKQTVPVAVRVKDINTNTIQEATATAEAVKTETGDIDVTLPETIAIDVPKAPPKLNELGMYYDGDKVIYYKRDLLTVGNKIQAAPWLGAAYNVDDKEFKLMVGMAIRW